MSFFSAVGQAVRVAQKADHAVEAALAAIETGKGPIGAVDAFAAAAGGELPARVAKELRDGIEDIISFLNAASGWVEVTAEVIDQANGTVIDLGLMAANWKAVLKTWMEEAQ